MKNNLVVKDNALINASYNLDLVEQRLILLAIVEARESQKGISPDKQLIVHASSYINHFDVEKHTAYAMLKAACESLFSRQFSYKLLTQKGNNEYVKSRWVSKISYADKEAYITLVFAPDVVPLITRLEKRFTSYELSQVKHLTSRYALRLYELLVAWRSTGKTPIFSVHEFRNQMGIQEDEYSRIEALKRRVIEEPIKQINNFTDILVEYEQHKNGRSITGFSFTFKQKRKSLLLDNKKTSDIQLTEKQISSFARKLVKDEEFSGKYGLVGESYEQFEARLIQNLHNQETVKKYLKYLKKVGLNI
ncbi:replication initiation protein RepM [Acinetobacter sp. ANC 4639]